MFAALPCQVEAVEIDAPGCSYNPDPEEHQEAVAQAVAAEVSKQYAEEMLPKPVKILRLQEPDELEALLVCSQKLSSATCINFRFPVQSTIVLTHSLRCFPSSSGEPVN